MLALHFIVSIIILKNYFKYLKFYDKIVSSVYGACCLGYLWVVFNAIIIKACETIDYRG